MTNFLYTGDQAFNADLNIKTGDKIEKKTVMLNKGDAVTLPEDHLVVAGLVRKGLLVENKSNSIAPVESKPRKKQIKNQSK